eukprot:COSAG02_NODE_1335_length_13197_cov_5.830279_5_plen_47_part_00
MALLLAARARCKNALLTPRGAPARSFGGHGHGDGKYTFDRTPAVPP